MSLKDKMLNKVADFVDKYKTQNYDYIDNCTINGTIRGVLTDDNYIQELPDKSYNGLINLKKTLDDELGDNKYKIGNISFCDDGNVICICNKAKSKYVETVHECFDYCDEESFIICNDKQSYESAKEFVKQSQEYHIYYEEILDIPHQNAFNKIFKVGELKKENQEENSKQNTVSPHKEEIDINKNYIKLDGEIKNIGKPFKTRDGYNARFIEVVQHYERNGKLKTNNFSVMLEDKVFDEYDNKININDKVNLSGTVSTYVDKNNKPQFSINCYEIEILERDNTQFRSDNR